MTMVFGRSGSGPYLTLESNDGSFDDLVTVKTGGRYKIAVTDVIRNNLESWMKNPYFETIRDQPLDLAIVARIIPKRMRSQDIDNLAKVVLDALKKKEGDPRFLFHDDSQIVRLIVWKIKRQEQEGWNTDSLTISFRIHDDKKQMVLVEPETM
jgi:Holliday junction resolvase RusA-like endonuclease